jgi:phospholipase C
MDEDGRVSDLAREGDLRDPDAAERFAFSAPDEYLRRREFLQRTAMTAGLAAGLATVLDPDTLVAEAARSQRRAALPSPRNLPIDTFVVLMMENRSFDHYLGWLPHADGRQAGLAYTDRSGRRLHTHRLTPDFQGCAHAGPDHSWDGGREQVHGGKMDGFLRSGANDEFAIGYYQEGDLGFVDAAARTCTAYDRMFCSLLAPTFPNREYLWAAESYGVKDNSTPAQVGHDTGFPDNTIFAALDKIGVSNRYFYNDVPMSALWGQSALNRSAMVSEYYTRCANGTLPALSFVDPSFVNASGGTSGDEHPHGDIRVGQAFMSDVVHAFMESPHWPRGVIFIVYDEWGGFFDHVRPPRMPDMRNDHDVSKDFGQTGIRIPAVAISPWARRGYVSHTVLTPISILKMISYRFVLAPLNRRLAYSPNIARTFDWDHKPRLDIPQLPTPPHVVGMNCPNRPPFVLAPKAGAAARPKPHDFALLRDSGYLQRLGFHYRPATPATMFRQPLKVQAAHRAAGG